jgi:hypothetical protein
MAKTNAERQADFRARRAQRVKAEIDDLKRRLLRAEQEIAGLQARQDELLAPKPAMPKPVRRGDNLAQHLYPTVRR